MLEPGRSYSASGSYRYGFNGKENDNDVGKGEGNQQDYGMRIYDPRIGKFLSMDPLSNSYPWYTPYQFAGNSPIANIDMDGGEPKPVNPGTTEGDFQETSVTSNRGLHNISIKKTADWYWHKGSKGVDAGWYSKDDYDQIHLDWEHGQVMVPFKKKFFDDDPYAKGGEIYTNGPGRDWNGWQVNQAGYLTGKKFQGGFFASFNLLEWIDGAGELRVLGALSEGRSFLKEGDYLLYYGSKVGKPYIGSTPELLARYSEKEIRDLGAKVFKFFTENPTVRMPNRGIAIGFEQLVIRLNNAGENISKANQGVNLANKINSAVKPIYIEEATKWAEKNIPNWRELFKIK